LGIQSILNVLTILGIFDFFIYVFGISNVFSVL